MYAQFEHVYYTPVTDSYQLFDVPEAVIITRLRLIWFSVLLINTIPDCWYLIEHVISTIASAGEQPIGENIERILYRKYCLMAPKKASSNNTYLAVDF